MTKSDFYKYRTKAGLSQPKAALVIGKTTRWVQYIEAGQYNPTPADITALMVLSGEDIKKIEKYLKKVFDKAK